MLNNRFIKTLASLRLTVTCLAFAVVLVFWGTLAQVRLGLYQAQSDFFRSFFVFLQFPESGLKVPIFPGGYLIGTVLLVNLIAAHLSRFRFAWRKIGILAAHSGIIVLLVGVLLTDLLSTESALRLNVGETRNYSEDFFENELAVIQTTGSDTEQVVTIPESVVAQKGQIRDSNLPAILAIKNYWPNCELFERPPAGAHPAGATRGFFAGYLVLPVSASQKSTPTTAAVVLEVLSNGETHGSWLLAALADKPEGFNLAGRRWQISLAPIPAMGGNVLLLTESGRTPGAQPSPVRESRLYAGNEIAPDGAPFKVRILQFWSHCKLYRKPVVTTVFPQVNRGPFTSIMVEPLPQLKSLDARNQAAVVVEVISKGESLGTWLLPAGLGVKQSMSVNGVTYELMMRSKRHYNPFSMTLLKATHEKYPGTEIPKDFRSRVRVQRQDTGEVRESEIYMNAPLRFAGYTFYQHQMSAADGELLAGQRPSSTFQVVKNPSWLTPYVSCALIAAGFLVQFLMHLTGFLFKRGAA